MGVLQPTINRDFLLSAMNDQGMEVYLIKMGTQSRLVEFHAASFISKIVQCVESLHLLENACEANQLLVSWGKKTTKIWYLDDLLYYFSNSFDTLIQHEMMSLNEPSMVSLNFVIRKHSYVLANSCNLFVRCKTVAQH